MNRNLTEAHCKTIETTNGYKIIKTYSYSIEINYRFEIKYEIDLCDSSDGIIKTETFCGNLDATVKNFKAVFPENVDLYINEYGRIYILDDLDRPCFNFLKTQDDVIKPSFKTFIYG